MNKRVTSIFLLVLLAVIFIGCGFENDVEKVETFLDHHSDDEKKILQRMEKELGISVDDRALPLDLPLLQSFGDFHFAFLKSLLVGKVVGIRFTDQKPEAHSQFVAYSYTDVRIIHYYTKFPSGHQKAHEIAHQVWWWLAGEKADKVRDLFIYLHDISGPGDYISDYAAEEREKLQWLEEDFCETFTALAVYSWKMPFEDQFLNLRSFYDRPILLTKMLTVMELFEDSEGEFQVLATFRGGYNLVHTNTHFYRVQRSQEGIIDSIQFPLGIIKFGYPTKFEGLANITRSVLADYPLFL